MMRGRAEGWGGGGGAEGGCRGVGVGVGVCKGVKAGEGGIRGDQVSNFLYYFDSALSTIDIISKSKQM